MPAPEIVNMFAVPFAFSRHGAQERLNPALKRYCLAAEKGGNAANPRPLTQRNAATFESHFNLFRDPDPAIQELKTFCWDQLLAVIGTLNRYDRATLERLQIFNNAWFHVTRRGGFFGVHNHPNASWSGVYCVDAGRHDAASKDSGRLTFVNPMIMSAMYIDVGTATNSDWSRAGSIVTRVPSRSRTSTPLKSTECLAALTPVTRVVWFG